jgi:hypothetical protein
MRAEKERALAGFARMQYGIAPRQQLFDVGFTRKQVDYLLRIGRLERVFEAVYRVAGVPTSWEQHLLAACWAGGVRGSFASHRAACQLWVLPNGERMLEVTGPRWRRCRHSDVIAHETKRLDPIDLAVVNGSIPVTRPARTFLDCCALAERGIIAPAGAELVLEEAIRRNIADISLVGWRWEQLGGERRLGGALARKLIDRWLPGTAKADSGAEARLLRLIDEHGLPMPVPQHRVWLGPDECVDLDFAWPEFRVGLEFDSYRYHGGRLKHDADARRELRLEARSWHILRVTDDELDAGCPNALAALGRWLPRSQVRR